MLEHPVGDKFDVALTSMNTCGPFSSEKLQKW